MKLTVEKGVISVQAETIEDVEMLLTLVDRNPLDKKPRATHKKHYKKDCSICGKSFKGLKLHTTKKHSFADMNGLLLNLNTHESNN